MYQEKSSDNGSSIRHLLRRIIFGTDTKLGRYFDIALIVCIILSVALVFLDTVASIHERYGEIINILEWGFTIIFTLEYLLRLYCSAHPLRYARIFYGVVDFLSVMPSYLAIFFPGASFTLVIRILRLFRIFRV
ncbi:ion transporter, partial [Shewanella sp.]|uniref:ion transporter n=1 Tax=Shewanella sp. TaxID=50422 RepID=UPI00258AB196